MSIVFPVMTPMPRVLMNAPENHERPVEKNESPPVSRRAFFILNKEKSYLLDCVLKRYVPTNQLSM